MFTIRSPIQRQHLSNGKVCLVNQLFGENKNSLFYGPLGHSGADLRTVGIWEFKPYNQKFVNGKWEGNWIQQKRDVHEQQGRIPLVACHDGTIRLILQENKQKSGWGLYVESEPMQEEGKTVQYRTLYWHIESPWRTLKPFLGYVMTKVIDFTVKRGQPLAIAGNNGKSTGPHVHLELQRRKKIGDSWGAWVLLDPMKHFDDEDIVYSDIDDKGHERFFYKGAEIDRARRDEIINSLPQVIFEKPII